jgi:hypothetical protein
MGLPRKKRLLKEYEIASMEMSKKRKQFEAFFKKQF